jgi:hypothetical protein
MWNSLIDSDPSGQILTARIAKEELRAPLSLARAAMISVVRTSTTIAAIAATIGASGLVACSSTHHYPDERGWFRSFTQRIAQNMRAPSFFALTPTADPYVGTCANHRADVSWQATLSAQVVNHYPDTPAGRHDLSQTILGRVSLVSGLPAEDRSVIAASQADPRATDTWVLEPSHDSRVQVSAPVPTAILAVGYVSC